MGKKQKQKQNTAVSETIKEQGLICDNWPELFIVTDAESHDKAVSTEPHLLTYRIHGWRLCKFTNYPCVP